MASRLKNLKRPQLLKRQSTHKSQDEPLDVKNLLQRARSNLGEDFLYLNYSSSRFSEFFSPYNLKIVPFDKIDKNNYLTISRNGITHFSNTRDPEFTKLDDWESEYEMYCQLKELHLFYYFIKWRTFCKWRLCVARRKFESARKRIHDKLLNVHGVLGPALHACQAVCSQLSLMGFTKSTDLHTSTLDDFTLSQTHSLEEITLHMQEFRGMLLENLAKACRSALLAEGFVVKAPRSSTPSPKGLHHSTNQKRKLMSSFNEDQEKKHKICGRLVCFIRLVDFKLQNSLHQLLTNSVEDFLVILKDRFLLLDNPDQKTPTPLSVLHLILSPDNLALKPTEDDFKSSFLHILSSWERCVLSFEPLLPDTSFNPYLEQTSREGPNLESILLGDKNLGVLQQEMLYLLKENFKAIYVCISQYDTIRISYAANMKTDAETIKTEIDLDIFRVMLLNYADQQHAIEQVVISQSLGIFLLRLDQFRDTAVPCLQDLRHLVNTTLPRVGRSKVTALSAESQDAQAFLELPPRTTLNFVEYLKFLDSISNRLEFMTEEMEYIRELHCIMQEYNVPCLKEDISAFLAFQTSLKSLKCTVEKRVLERSNTLQQFEEEMNRDVSMLLAEVAEVQSAVNEPSLVDVESDVEEVQLALQQLSNRLTECEQRAEYYRCQQQDYKLKVPRCSELATAREGVRLRLLLWDSLEHWEAKLEDWESQSFHSLDPEELSASIHQNHRVIMELERGLPENEVILKYKDSLENMKKRLPVIVHLRNPALEERHWRNISQLIGHSVTTDDSLTMRLLEDMEAFRHLQALQEISDQAKCEANLNTMLDKVEDQWKNLQFGIKQYNSTFVLEDIGHVLTVLDDSFMSLSTIGSSKFAEPIRPRVEQWRQKLDLFQMTLDEWMKCQNQWLSFESMFREADIQRKMSTEARMFYAVHKSWKTIMTSVCQNSLAMEVCTRPGLLETLKKNNLIFNQLSRCLTAFLESKRIVFARFYFLADQELLCVLSQPKNSEAIQPFLIKCFMGIATLQFKLVMPKKNSVVAMKSSQNEEVKLCKAIHVSDKPEDWLGNVESCMFETLRQLMRSAFLEYEQYERGEWAQHFPAQIILSIARVMWCRDFEKDIDSKGSLCYLQQKHANDLSDLVDYLEGGDITFLARSTLISLLLFYIHARDCTETLIQEDIQSSSSFEWQRQLRLYWDEEQLHCEVRMGVACHRYGYEYLGASLDHVWTALTDRCIFSLLSAMHMNLGGLVTGLAGAGRTNTIHILAQSLAVYCVMFHCSSSLDSKVIGQLLSGAAQSGSWCCLIGADLLSAGVLSTVAQMLDKIYTAKANKVSRFLFEGREIKLLHKFSAFLTTGPLYQGSHSQLPGNLKIQFRNISLPAPNHAYIAEAILFSRGFKTSKTIACKLSHLFQMCNQQLSQCDLHQFNFKAMKTILKLVSDLRTMDNYASEEVLIVDALRKILRPRLSTKDSKLFEGMIGDIFPELPFAEKTNRELESAIIQEAAKLGLEPEDSFVQNAAWLNDVLSTQHGAIIVGQPGVGKTSVYKVLQGALSLLSREEENHSTVHVHVLYPMSLSRDELFGSVNANTSEWKDGLLGVLFKKVSVLQEQHWIVCDGPLNSPWLDGLGSLLCEPRMLCLGSAEQVYLGEGVKVLFETTDLVHVSPSVIGRCSVVYIATGKPSWLPFVTSWIGRLLLPSDDKLMIHEMFSNHVSAGLSFVTKNCNQAITQVDVAKVFMLCSVFEGILLVTNNTTIENDNSLLKQMFIFSYFCALGVNLNEDSSKILDEFVVSRFKESLDPKVEDGLRGMFWNPSNISWEPWQNLIKKYSLRPDLPLSNGVVPTDVTARFGFLMEHLISVRHPVLLSGPIGAGKSLLAHTVLYHEVNKGDLMYAPISLLAHVSSQCVQQAFERRLERRRLNVLGAPRGKRILFFVDDLNLTRASKSAPTLELLRQYLDCKGLYDSETKLWKYVEDMVLSAACKPLVHKLDPQKERFLRHFAILNLSYPSNETLTAIFGSILNGFLTNPIFSEITSLLAKALVAVHHVFREEFLPVPAHPHYVVTPRSLQRCVRGMARADAASLSDTNLLIRLAYHECLREFQDRLTCASDRDKFVPLLRQTFKETLGDSAAIIHVSSNKQPYLYADFTSTKRGSYVQIERFETLVPTLQEHLDSYNELEESKLQLVLFGESAEHTVHIARALRWEEGHILLLGGCGLGKRNLSKLAAYLCGYKCHAYSESSNIFQGGFREYFRGVCLSAALSKQDSVIIVSDTQIKSDDCFSDIYCFMKTGDASFLYEMRHRAKAIEAIKLHTQDSAISAEKNEEIVFEHFIQRVRRKLHIALSMDPNGEKFRSRLRSFPSLTSCCTVDWFNIWPVEALLSVARVSLVFEPDEGMRSLLGLCSANMHMSSVSISKSYLLERGCHMRVTPSAFVEMLRLYKCLYAVRRAKLTEARDRVANGLKKLQESMESAEEMRQQLSKLEPELRQKTVATEALMKSLLKEQSQVEKVRQVVMTEEALVREKSEEAQSIATEAQKDLDEAIPAIETSLKALESIERNDLKDLRALTKPPQLVRFVLESVCLLMGCKTDWGSAKALVSDALLIKRAVEIDKDSIPDSTVRKLKEYVDHPNFVPEVVETQSRACRSFCMWVRAIDGYAKTYRAVLPKKKRLESAEEELAISMAELRTKQQKLAETEGQIGRLEASYDSSLAEQGALQAAVEQTSARLTRAGHLSNALSEEQHHWENALQEYCEQLQNLMGDTLLASASVTYFGAFLAGYRDKLSVTWKEHCQHHGMPFSVNTSFVQILGDPYEIQRWHSFGLPRNATAIENCLIITQTGKWPLMIDPHEQMVYWVKQAEAGQNLIIACASQPGYLELVKKSLQENHPLLLEDIQECPESELMEILQQCSKSKNKLNSQSGFKMYATTKLSKPDFHPDVFNIFAVVDCSLTIGGLEELFLSEVVRAEKPDVEQQFSLQANRISRERKQLDSVILSILSSLCTSRGDLLDNEELIISLSKDKALSDSMALDIEKKEILECSLSTTREFYRPVAIRGSVLFSVIMQMASINPMYQFSYHFILQIFKLAVKSVKEGEGGVEHLEQLMKKTTFDVFCAVTSGLRENHRLLFSLLICLGILKQSGEISDEECIFLLQDTPDDDDVPMNPSSTSFDGNVLSSNALKKLEAQFECFHGLLKSRNDKIVLNIGDMEQTIYLPGCEDSDLDVDWDQTLTNVQKLIVIKVTNQERLLYAFSSLVTQQLGPEYLERPPSTVQTLFSCTSKLKPLIFLLGAEPISKLKQMASELGKPSQDSCLHCLSLGHGQEHKAEQLLRKATQEGLWVYLSNCHLSAEWLHYLACFVRNLLEEPSSVQENFRLFMSSESTSMFPLYLLTGSTKICTDPPKGLRARLNKAWDSMDPEAMEDYELEKCWPKIISGFCHFDSVVRDRGCFGPYGWSFPYEFGEEHLGYILQLVHQAFNKEDSDPIDCLQHYACEIEYGGHVSNEWDQRCLKSTLQCFLSKDHLAQDQHESLAGFVLQNLSSKYLKTLPIFDDSSLFGISEVNFFSCKTQEGYDLLKAANKIYSCRFSHSKERFSLLLECIVSSLQFRSISPGVGSQRPSEQQHLDPLRVVFSQEVSHYNFLLDTIHSSLEAIQLAHKGHGTMTDTLEQLQQELLDNQVPDLWRQASYPSLLNLRKWIEDLNLRLNFMTSCLQDELPCSFWLHAFFSPKSFLASILQSHARKHNLPIEILSSEWEVTSIILHPPAMENIVNLQCPEDGVFIHGLFLDGASWDHESMIVAEPRRDEKYCKMPVMHLIPQVESTTHSRGDRRHLMPIYRTSARQHGATDKDGFITAVWLLTDKDSSLWSLRGAAILTEAPI